MLPKGLIYPQTWLATYTAKDKQKYACCITKAHMDDIEPYYTIDVLEGPFQGERQTVPERLTSYVDKLSRRKIIKIFKEYKSSQVPKD